MYKYSHNASLVVLVVAEDISATVSSFISCPSITNQCNEATVEFDVPYLLKKTFRVTGYYIHNSHFLTGRYAFKMIFCELGRPSYMVCMMMALYGTTGS